jgi:hypothetical protein
MTNSPNIQFRTPTIHDQLKENRIFSMRAAFSLYGNSIPMNVITHGRIVLKDGHSKWVETPARKVCWKLIGKFLNIPEKDLDYFVFVMYDFRGKLVALEHISITITPFYGMRAMYITDEPSRTHFDWVKSEIINLYNSFK